MRSDAGGYTGGVTPAPVLLTVGHGTLPEDSLVELLRGAGVGLLVDVRSMPGSRHNPQVARRNIERWLPAAEVAYRWEPRLGGRRTAPVDSPDVSLVNRSFAGYAAWTRTPAFAEAVDELLTEAGTVRTAVMCAETLWWRCHRRMIADFVTMVRGGQVLHLRHDGRAYPHRTTSGAGRRDDGLLVYDAGTLQQEVIDLPDLGTAPTSSET
ncbi:DUF488 family protein [Parafrankia sp. FMc2]|uniref:DUF488 domain-containing protein n=1 Tax=Parafrankia sp. FMc2 TaxID=3233196 RepID=UPI0034D6F16A